ncbi:MAG: PorT family protein [Bacteroidales bacterium]|nr:PorT family protein [Bacteroidales bacterium]
MKTIYILFLCLLLALSAPAQKIRGGLQAGAAITQVDGDDYGGYHKAGVFVGTFANYPFENIRCKLQMEINYVQKGSRATNNGIYKISLHQVEIPVMFGWNFWKGFYLQAGLSCNILAGAKETLDGEDLETDHKFHLFELGGVADLNYYFENYFGIGIKFNYSLSPIGRNYVLRSSGIYKTYMWNNALIFYLYYQF